MRRTVLRLASAAGFVTAICFSIVSHAEGAAPSASAASSAAQPVETARSRYRQGVEAYKGGHYREAIDYFLEADRLAPSAALSFNIALAYEKIDDAAAALRWYRDYLRRDPNTKDRAGIEGIIHGFESRLVAKGVQQVTVFSEPSAATLVIDDKPVGVTPFTTELAPGSHRIEVRRDGYDPARQALEVTADHATDVQVTLQASTAKEPSSAPASAAAPVTAPAGGASTESTPPANRFLFTTVGIVGLAAGGAALGGALTFELLRRSAESDAKSERTQVGFGAKVDTMEGRQTAARVFLGVGVVLAAAGGVLVYLGEKSGSEKDVAVGFGCVPGGCASSVRGRF